MKDHSKLISIKEDFENEQEVNEYIGYLEKLIGNSYIVFNNMEEVRLSIRGLFNKRMTRLSSNSEIT